MIERNIETARRRLAAEFGCDPEEIAITRNSSESLQIAQNGLDLKPGDEVLTTEQDYGRMLTTWDQRVRRDKIKLTQDRLPGADHRRGPVSARLDARDHAADQGAALLPHHQPVGPALPGAAPRATWPAPRGIITIVDGAHAAAHFPFKLRDLEMDYYGVSLHKWLLAPIGTGLLYVRRDRIAKTWPLQAAPATRDTDIRKFEEIGTPAGGAKAAINEAHRVPPGDRHRAQGGAPALPDAALGQRPARPSRRSSIHSNLAEGQTWGLAVVSIDGVDTEQARRSTCGTSTASSSRRSATTTPTTRALSYRALRVTPNIYTPLEEIDTFVDAMRAVVKNGLPA